MRAAIKERDPEKRKAFPIHGQVWPYTLNSQDRWAPTFFINDDVHVVVVLNQRCLFGKCV